MLKIKNLWFKYGSSRDWVLKNINLSFSSTGLYLVSGPSGSGKSTLARIIAGLIPRIYRGVLRGVIEIDGEAIDPQTDFDKLTARVGFLGQQPELYAFSSTVKRELIDSLEYSVDSRDEILDELEKLVIKFQLGDLLNKPLTELSAGQLQRVEIAALFARNPRILVLDEPLSRLDPPTKEIISDLLSELSRERLIIVFEHDLELLLYRSKECIVLDNGIVKSQGDPREIVWQMNGVDIPLIAELFLELKKELNMEIKHLPLTIEEALKVLERLM